MTLILSHPLLIFIFFFNDTATTEIYTLSLHDALPISPRGRRPIQLPSVSSNSCGKRRAIPPATFKGTPQFKFSPLTSLGRSEEHTSELQSLAYLVCRLLLEKKKKMIKSVY